MKELGCTGCEPAAPRLDSEHFRCAPTTCHPLRGRLGQAGGVSLMVNLRRRDFVTLLGGAAAAWPLAARAQRPQKVPTIGFLGSLSQSAQSTWTAAFVQRMREHGWIEGRTVAIEYRWAEGRRERFAEIAAEFVRLNVDVIVTAGTDAGIPAKKATSVN